MSFDPHGAAWRTSTYTQSTGGQCVEVAPAGAVVGVRDTKNREGGHLAVSPAAFAGLVSFAKGRESLGILAPVR